MVEWTAREREDAERIVDHLVSDDGNDFDFNTSALSIVDIEADAILFRREMRFLDYADMSAPALHLADSDEWIPVSISMLWQSSGGPILFRDFFDFSRPSSSRASSLRAVLGHLFERSGLHTIPVKEARHTFTEKATNFLATRIAGVRDISSHVAGEYSYLNVFRRIRGKRISAPGCTFTITTNNRGLRVLWSGAYYISGNYFGHPTFPVTGVMMAGTYVFGVDGGAYGGTVQWDHSKCTLPGRPSIHLNF